MQECDKFDRDVQECESSVQSGTGEERYCDDSSDYSCDSDFSSVNSDKFFDGGDLNELLSNEVSLTSSQMSSFSPGQVTQDDVQGYSDVAQCSQANSAVMCALPDTSAPLSQELAVWALKHPSVTHASLDDLLKLLIKHGHEDLPKRAKTLLKTPRSTKGLMTDLCSGQYWYGGILNGIKSRLHCENITQVHGQSIHVDIFIDGISPCKKVKLHVVALAGCIVGQKKPFVIALWCGRTRDPVGIHEFFGDFIAEAAVMKEGFVLYDIFCKLVIEKYIGDTPAREWMLQVVMFNAFWGRERCVLYLDELVPQ